MFVANTKTTGKAVVLILESVNDEDPVDSTCTFSLNDKWSESTIPYYVSNSTSSVMMNSKKVSVGHPRHINQIHHFPPSHARR